MSFTDSVTFHTQEFTYAQVVKQQAQTQPEQDFTITIDQVTIQESWPKTLEAINNKLKDLQPFQITRTGQNSIRANISKDNPNAQQIETILTDPQTFTDLGTPHKFTDSDTRPWLCLNKVEQEINVTDIGMALKQAGSNISARRRMQTGKTPCKLIMFKLETDIADQEEINKALDTNIIIATLSSSAKIANQDYSSQKLPFTMTLITAYYHTNNH